MNVYFPTHTHIHLHVQNPRITIHKSRSTPHLSIINPGERTFRVPIPNIVLFVSFLPNVYFPSLPPPIIPPNNLMSTTTYTELSKLIAVAQTLYHNSEMEREFRTQT